LKKIILILLLMILPSVVWAEYSVVSKEITMTSVDALKLSKSLTDKGDFDKAEQILTQMPPLGNGALETERWFLMGRISAFRGDFNTAITIYRRILDSQPDLARIRFELAVCYMKTNQWYRADYHLRLAMAGDDLPDEVKKIMNYYRYVVRKNKGWNAWLNFGAAPDDNINASPGGEECVNTMFGPMCRQLPDPESAIGYNLGFGGDYEFKLSEQWRWKSDANIYAGIYDKHRFDDLYLSASTGPRYVWNNGDVWLAGISSRRWYGWNPYSWSYGAKVDANYDFTRKLSGGLSLRFMENAYDEYGGDMDGKTYGVNARLSYSIDATKYILFRAGLDREITATPAYANWRPFAAVGFGAELPYGFHIYLEPSVRWAIYDSQRWIVKNGAFAKLAERDFTQRYSVSISNNNLEIWGFVPALTFSYTNRGSNIWQREFDKYAIEFTMQQRF
jgi:tetratricopeptide (TPR) repeat protein